MGDLAAVRRHAIPKLKVCARHGRLCATSGPLHSSRGANRHDSDGLSAAAGAETAATQSPQVLIGQRRYLRMGRPLSGLTAAFAAATLLVGCGGGTHDFVAEGNAICRAGEKAGEGASEPRTRAELGAFFDKSLSLGRDELARLEKLEPPPDRATAFHAYLSGLNATLAVVVHADVAAKAGDISGLRTIMQRGAALGRQNRANARSAGLDTCAQAD